MLGVFSFVVSIVSAIMALFSSLQLPSFAIAMLGIILAVISTYDKDTTETENKNKSSKALEMGSIVISGAAILSYFVFAIIAKL